MIRFVHAADLHLDSPFRGLGKQNESVAVELRRATLAAFDRLVELCLDEEIDFLLVAGDVYDGRDRSLRAQMAFRDGLARLASRGIRSFVVHGNHDPDDGWAASIEWPEGITVFGSSEARRVTVERGGRPIAEISGISYARRKEDRALQKELRPGDPALFQIALLHANCGGSKNHEDYVPCSPEELAGAGFDYWALGHVHEKRDWNLGCRIVYPGNLQGRSVRELGPRGAYLVEVGEDQATNLTFRELDEVRWQAPSIDIAGMETIDDLEGAVDDRIEQLRSEAGTRALVIRLRLQGSGVLAEQLRHLGAVDDLLERLRESTEALSPLVWIESLREHTTSQIDLDKRRGQQDFLGHVLASADEIRALEVMPVPLSERLGALYEHHQARRLLDPPDGRTLESLVTDAERLCFELLEGEE